MRCTNARTRRPRSRNNLTVCAPVLPVAPVIRNNSLLPVMGVALLSDVFALTAHTTQVNRSVFLITRSARRFRADRSTGLRPGAAGRSFASSGIGARDARVAVAVTAPDSATSDPTIDLGRFGVFRLGATPDQAREIERLGYGTIWVGGSPQAELSFVEPLLESTTALQVATGIVKIRSGAAPAGVQ